MKSNSYYSTVKELKCIVINFHSGCTQLILWRETVIHAFPLPRWKRRELSENMTMEENQFYSCTDACPLPAARTTASVLHQPLNVTCFHDNVSIIFNAMKANRKPESCMLAHIIRFLKIAPIGLYTQRVLASVVRRLEAILCYSCHIQNTQNNGDLTQFHSTISTLQENN